MRTNKMSINTEGASNNAASMKAEEKLTEGRGLHEGLHVGVPGDLMDGEEDAGLPVRGEQSRREHREPARRAPHEHLRGAHPPLQCDRHATVVADRDVAGAHPVDTRSSSSCRSHSRSLLRRLGTWQCTGAATEGHSARGRRAEWTN
jgi:hypothetical protein